MIKNYIILALVVWIIYLLSNSKKHEQNEKFREKRIINPYGRRSTDYPIKNERGEVNEDIRKNNL